MKILFDQGTPAPLRKHLTDHQIDTAFELNWESLNNGELISRAESENYEVLITTDQNLKYQQNLKNRRISIFVLSTTSWLQIQKRIDEITKCLDSISIGKYIEILI